MKPTVFVLIFIIVLNTTNGDWFEDMTSQEGLSLGNGFKIYLDDTKVENTSLLERHTLRLFYDDIGMSIGKVPEKNAVSLGFFSNNSEGRAKKTNELILPFMIGYKFATIATTTFTLLTVFVVKALGVAKLALISTAIIMIAKLFYEHSNPSYVEHHSIDEHPIVVDTPPSNMAYHPSGSSNYYTYTNYAPQMENAMGFADTTNASTIDSQHNQAGKRKDIRKKLKIPFMTVHRYSIATR